MLISNIDIRHLPALPLSCRTALLFHILILSFKRSCSFLSLSLALTLFLSAPFLLQPCESPYKYGTCICKCGLSTPGRLRRRRGLCPWLRHCTRLCALPLSLTPPIPLPCLCHCLLWLQFNIHFEKAHLHLRFCGTFACASTVFCFSPSRAGPGEWACERKATDEE